MTNKELIQLLSGIPMKCEVEILHNKQALHVAKVTRLHIPEKKDEQGRVVPGRNIVQIVTTGAPDPDTVKSK